MIGQENKPAGFTLIELLVVIAIIGILSALGLVSLHGAQEKARDAQAKNDLGQVITALRVYAEDHDGQYPGSYSAAGSEYSSCSGDPEKIDPSIWTEGGELVPEYLGRELVAPACHDSSKGGYWYQANNTVDGGPTINCQNNDCFVLFYQLESGGDPRRFYMIFEDGQVVDFLDNQTSQPVCDDGGDCHL